MWKDSRYFWIVLCKNHWFHIRKNFLFRHRIPLAETNPVTPRPPVEANFKVRCDKCGKEYVYKPSEVLRTEYEPPDSFSPHPLFREEGTGPFLVADRSPENETNEGPAMTAAQRYEIWRDFKTGRYCVTAVVSPMFDTEEQAKEHRRALVGAEKAERSTAYRSNKRARLSRKDLLKQHNSAMRRIP
jgi:hypothetical protein